MPLYDYGCSKCGGRVEVIQKFSDDPLVNHDGCGGRLQKVLHAPAIMFKGGGWTPRSDSRSPEERGRRTEEKLLSGEFDEIDAGS